MVSMTRRTVLKAAGASLFPLPAIAQDSRARTLTFVPQSNLSILDATFTTGGITQAHAYAVFDMLYALDSKHQPKPQMAEGHTVSADGLTWLIRLRPGLKFHDNEPVRAVDCAASIRRWGLRDNVGRVLLNTSEAIEAADDRTIRIRLKRPFPLVPYALARPMASVCPMMPARIANADDKAAIQEMVGSGPYRFLKDEYNSGVRVAYARFDGYVPRDEAPDLTSGGKRAHFERLEWTIIPDAATASAALAKGEVDWWDYAAPDLIQQLKSTGQITISPTDPLGGMSALRFNSIQPPFNNPRLKRAVLEAIDQTDYMLTITGGDRSAWEYCYAFFTCGAPHVREIGADIMKLPKDLEKSKAAIKAAGYNGEKVVIINPSDFPTITPHGIVTAELLKKLGMNVELQTMDWGATLQRRIKMEPVEQGGWSIFHTWTPGLTLSEPASAHYVRGQGRNGGYPGWFENAEIERLVTEWFSAPTDADRDRIYDGIQRIAFEEVPFVPLGKFMSYTAYRKDITGVIPFIFALPWNVRRA
jgi:peptide/nickel transport system substrate-binding protein